MSTSSLHVPGADVSRSSSIKDKFRAMSRGRHRAEVAEGHTRTGVIKSDDLETFTRGRSPLGRASTHEPEVSSLQVPRDVHDDIAPSLEDETGVSASTEQQQVQQPAPETRRDNVVHSPSIEDLTGQPAGGFLSSVFSAASNLGTALTSGKSPIGRHTEMRPIIQDPSANTNVHESVPNRAITMPLAELSLKDMGLSEHNETDELRRPRTSSQATSVQLKDDHAEKQSGQARSGSVITTAHRKRRESTTASIFGTSEHLNQKITGFAVASNKRNREFHATFRSVQRRIIYSMIMVVHYKRKSCAWPHVSCLQNKHVFASFISRDTTFELIVNIWRITHPRVHTTAHGVEAIDPDEVHSAMSPTSVAMETMSHSPNPSLKVIVRRSMTRKRQS
ncbi:hypothetical protein MRB53_039313 [Persea americana]|nr:hypothetical protein MRB53_039313 [Persea americana]